MLRTTPKQKKEGIMKKDSPAMILIYLICLAFILTGCETSDSGCGTETAAPYISSAGIGVSDMDASIEFYTNVLELELVERRDGSVAGMVEEAVLEDYRGNKLYLMDFGDSRNYKDNPAKVVFGVPDANDYYDAALEAGASVLSRPADLLGTTVGLAYEIDGYIIEMIEADTLSSPIVAAIGIGVEDLNEARDYYTDVIGMEYSTRMPVVGLMREMILVSPLDEGLQLVLMNFNDPKDYQDVPVKVCFNVSDGQQLADAIEAEGSGEILSAPSATSSGYATDLYGYLLEIIEE
jgi:catechol 2,3-dioxygenase-like lactoylglutathione lyase family enzyme